MMTLLALREALSRGPSLSVFVLFFSLSLFRSPSPPPSPLWAVSYAGSQELHSDIDPSYCRLLNN